MIRKMMHAGTFYPRFPAQILRQIDTWLKDSTPFKTEERTLGMLLPHAGYIYSGHCASLGLASMTHELIDSFIILHPSHHGAHFDFSVSPYTEYETPLGNIALDSKIYNQLSKEANQNVALHFHQEEHSLEIQLPLLKHFFPQATICPVMIGNQVPPVSERLAEILYDLISKSGRRIVVLVSSDLSHYHTSHKAEEMDSMVAKYFMDLAPEALWQADQEGQVEACGIGGILCLLYFALHYTTKNPKIVYYTHSGKVSGNNSQVVGYLAAKITN